MKLNEPLSVFVVGPGARFLSGISYYTASVARALRRSGMEVNVLLVRRLCPQWMYPGRRRVGVISNDVLALEGVHHQEGLDWYGGPSLIRALHYLRSSKPDVLLLNWWTVATAHNYIVLSLVASRKATRTFIEYHEIQDVSEGRLLLGRLYLRLVMRILGGAAAGAIVHSRCDAERVRDTFPALRGKPILIAYHPPSEHRSSKKPVSEPRPSRTRLLFFGVIRPYKGLEELAEALTVLRARGTEVSLVVAGEPWRAASDVHLELGYVDDERVGELFSAADVVVLPYRRASASGPISIAMGSGLPIVTTRIPAIEEVLETYGGAVLAEPGSSASLVDAIERSLALVGQQFPCPHTWDGNIARYREFFSAGTDMG
jgi:glycosyltransferase involved in cell wall biosynthesis